LLGTIEGGAQRSLSRRRGSRSSCRVALPPCEAGGSGSTREGQTQDSRLKTQDSGLKTEDSRCNHGRRSRSTLGSQRDTRVSPSPKVMPHETSRIACHHPLALRFAPRSVRALATRDLSARNLFERSQPASQLARFGVHDARARFRVHDARESRNTRQYTSGRSYNSAPHSGQRPRSNDSRAL
jgi:hypothetical protein